MEKENATEVKTHATKEHKRMIELVERARKLDPRIRAGEAAALEAKQATKNAAANKKNEEKAKLMAAKNALQKEEDDKKAAEKAADEAARELV
jgi:hypothetical protein